MLWSYSKGVVINSTISLGGGRVYFIDSRNPALATEASGRIGSAALWGTNTLVSLDAATGALVWEQPITVPSVPAPIVLFLSYANEKLLISDSSGAYRLFCHSAPDGRRLWTKTHPWNRDNHGGHMYHPVIVGNLAIVEPYGYDLRVGQGLRWLR